MELKNKKPHLGLMSTIRKSEFDKLLKRFKKLGLRRLYDSFKENESDILKTTTLEELRGYNYIYEK